MNDAQTPAQLNMAKVGLSDMFKNVRMLERILRGLHSNLYLDGRRDDVDNALFILNIIKNNLRVVERHILERKEE